MNITKYIYIYICTCIIVAPREIARSKVWRRKVLCGVLARRSFVVRIDASIRSLPSRLVAIMQTPPQTPLIERTCLTGPDKIHRTCSATAVQHQTPYNTGPPYFPSCLFLFQSLYIFVYHPIFQVYEAMIASTIVN